VYLLVVYYKVYYNHIIITEKNTLNTAHYSINIAQKLKQAQNAAQIMYIYCMYTSEAEKTCFTSTSWRKIIASQAKYVA